MATKKQTGPRPALTPEEIERRKKLSERMKAKWADPEWVKNFRGGRRHIPIKKIDAEKRKAEARAAKEAEKAAAKAAREEAKKPKPYVPPGVVAPAVVTHRPGHNAILKEPPANAAEIITQGAAGGLTMGGIASLFGIDATTLRRWQTEYPSIKEALIEGRVREEGILVGALMQKALEGNVVAAIFLLKARHQYSDSGAPLTANSVSINFTLPGSLSPKDYVETVAASAQIVPPETARQLAGQRKVKSALKNEAYRMRREAEGGDGPEGDEL